MLRLQAYQYELMPTGEQQHDLRCFAGSCRFVYNKALDLQQTRYAAGENKLNYAELCAQLTEWKQIDHWLRDTPSQALQQSLKDLGRAYDNFFAKRADFPRFKKRGQHDAFRFPQGCKLEQANHRIFLPKLGWIRYRNSREVLGSVKNVTVSYRHGKWMMSIQTELEVETPRPQSGSDVGIDMGIIRFATLSNGEYFEPLNSFKQHQDALRKAQQALSRKVKYRRNWKKAKAKVQAIHTQISNARRDYLHKTSHTISQNHALVCIEDLQVRNMSKSAAGDAENHGKNVAAKSGLNKAILDQGWFEFRRQLDYKLAWAGGLLIAVPPHNSSRTCPTCGHISAENRKTQAEFACVSCGFKENADVVGAINLLRAGHAQLACEVSDAAMSPAAGTHRSDLNAAKCSDTVGISVL